MPGCVVLDSHTPSPSFRLLRCLPPSRTLACAARAWCRLPHHAPASHAPETKTARHIARLFSRPLDMAFSLSSSLSFVTHHVLIISDSSFLSNLSACSLSGGSSGSTIGTMAIITNSISLSNRRIECCGIQALPFHAPPRSRPGVTEVFRTRETSGTRKLRKCAKTTKENPCVFFRGFRVLSRLSRSRGFSRSKSSHPKGFDTFYYLSYNT